LDRTLLSRDPVAVADAESDPLNYHGRLPARTGAELLRATQQLATRLDALHLPVLCVHGTADGLTDPEGSKALYREAPSTDKTLVLLPGLYHETFNEPEHERVRRALTDWLAERLPESDRA
jgi:alpha-beta hydrolase superfamily lysophospholipase